MAKKIKWNENGWTVVQEANQKKHVREIICRCENGKVVEVRIRPSRGEERVAKVTLNGEPALPMDTEQFQAHFDKNEIEMN